MKVHELTLLQPPPREAPGSTCDYLNVINLEVPRLSIGMEYEAIEYHHNFPSGVKYAVVVLSYTLKGENAN